jgi:transposase-like protein
MAKDKAPAESELAETKYVAPVKAASFKVWEHGSFSCGKSFPAGSEFSRSSLDEVDSRACTDDMIQTAIDAGVLTPL